jgi:parallel beta-helix repeat protein
MRSLLLLLVLVLALAAPAFATDGVFEINQTCAVETGCFAGDAAGFPVTIASPGSYRLTSNLVVADPNRDAITTGDTSLPVNWTDDVGVDLNGFTISGPGTCTGLGSAVDCSPGGFGDGIDASGSDCFGLEDGGIRGFGRNGVILGDRARVRNIVAESNASGGISAGSASIMSGNTAYQNAGDGLSAGPGSTLSNNTAHSNGSDGISASEASTVSRNAAFGNGSRGIDAGPGSTVEGNTANHNQFGIVSEDGSIISGNTAQQNENGIIGGVGSTIYDNAVFQNASTGISTGSGTSISGNTVRSNAVGLSMGSTTIYRDNTITENSTIAILDLVIGVNLGGNYCAGNGVTSSSCP